MIAPQNNIMSQEKMERPQMAPRVESAIIALAQYRQTLHEVDNVFCISKNGFIPQPGRGLRPLKIEVYEWHELSDAFFKALPEIAHTLPEMVLLRPYSPARLDMIPASIGDGVQLGKVVPSKPVKHFLPQNRDLRWINYDDQGKEVHYVSPAQLPEEYKPFIDSRWNLYQAEQNYLGSTEIEAVLKEVRISGSGTATQTAYMQLLKEVIQIRERASDQSSIETERLTHSMRRRLDNLVGTLRNISFREQLRHNGGRILVDENFWDVFKEDGLAPDGRRVYFDLKTGKLLAVPENEERFLGFSIHRKDFKGAETLDDKYLCWYGLGVEGALLGRLPQELSLDLDILATMTLDGH